MNSKPYTGETALKQSYELFCRGLAKGLCQADAYRQAGYTANNADAAANQLLRRPDIQARKAYLEKKQTEAIDVTIGRVLRENACIAFADPKDLLDDNGALLSLDNMPEKIRRAIQSVEVIERPNGTRVFKYKLWSKDNALEKFFKNLGMYAEDNEQKTPQFLLAVGRSDIDKAKQVESEIVERDLLESVDDNGDVVEPKYLESDTMSRHRDSHAGSDIMSRIEALECPE